MKRPLSPCGRGAMSTLVAIGLFSMTPLKPLASEGPDRPAPVIFDTDIGSDIDDTWALAYLLNCPELDLKLVVTATGDTTYRAKIVAKFLEVGRSSHIPVGIGMAGEPGNEFQKPWVEGYELEDYPGEIHGDGVQAMIDFIHSSSEPVTIIAVGPVTNIHEALRRDPSIAAKCRFVGMHGSVDVGYGGNSEPAAEYNVKADVPAFRAVLAADWIDLRITPLDTCGDIILDGERYQSVFNSDLPTMRALIENYGIWSGLVTWVKIDSIENQSSALFDTVAVFMACSNDWIRYETIPIVATDEGFTQRDTEGRKVVVAMEWSDKNAFLNHLTNRLLK